MEHKCSECKYKGEYQGMGFASMSVCTRTTDLCEAEKNYNAEKCPYKLTNADRIRSMSDEELAYFLCSIAECSLCRWSAFAGCSLRNWLRQSADKQ